MPPPSRNLTPPAPSVIPSPMKPLSPAEVIAKLKARQANQAASATAHRPVPNPCPTIIDEMTRDICGKPASRKTKGLCPDCHEALYNAVPYRLDVTPSRINRGTRPPTVFDRKDKNPYRAR